MKPTIADHDLLRLTKCRVGQLALAQGGASVATAEGTPSLTREAMAARAAAAA